MKPAPKSEHVASVYATQSGIAPRPFGRIGAGQYYRVTERADDGRLIARWKAYTLRAAYRLASAAESAGLTAEITVRRIA